ncbi:hypothetical protein JCM3766R1_006869 [Sporobolomyces carnicolor]
MDPAVDTSRKELGLLIVVILKAQHLPDPHRFSKQDPFVIATDGQGEEIFRTPTDRGGGQHPLWDEEFRYKLYENAGVQNLTFKVMRKEGVRAKDEELIGTGSVPVDGRSWIEYDEWIELKTPEGKFAGELYVEMTFYPLESQRKASSSDLKRHPSKLDPSSRAPVPASLQPGSLHHSLSEMTLQNSRYQPHSTAKHLPAVPQEQDLLPFPGDPEPLGPAPLPASLRPGFIAATLPMQHSVMASSNSLPLPGELRHDQEAPEQQSHSRATPIPSHPGSHPSLATRESDPALSSSPGQYSYSPLAHPLQHQQPASYPFLTPGSQHVHSSSLPTSPPPIPPRPSSAASSINETMPGSFHPKTPRDSSSSHVDRPFPSSESPANRLPPPRLDSRTSSPSTSQFPRASSFRPPLPPNPVGTVSSPAVPPPALASKHQEAAQDYGHNRDVSLPPPSYRPALPQRSSNPESGAAMVHDPISRAQEEREAEQARHARQREREERLAEEERARKERERIAEEKKLARIREAQEARARKLAQEAEDQRLAMEAEEREHALERERREAERRADEEFVQRLQAQERERETREREDEELARRLRQDDEAERARREREDEEYIKRLREEDERLAEEERQKRLVEDERLARSLAERENEEEERRRMSTRT